MHPPSMPPPKQWPEQPHPQHRHWQHNEQHQHPLEVDARHETLPQWHHNPSSAPSPNFRPPITAPLEIGQAGDPWGQGRTSGQALASPGTASHSHSPFRLSHRGPDDVSDVGVPHGRARAGWGARWWKAHGDALVGAGLGCAVVLALLACMLQLGVVGGAQPVPLAILADITGGPVGPSLEVNAALPGDIFTEMAVHPLPAEPPVVPPGGTQPGTEQGVQTGGQLGVPSGVPVQPLQEMGVEGQVGPASVTLLAVLSELMTYFDSSTALFGKDMWWNNANIFETLLDYAALTGRWVCGWCVASG